MEQQGDDVGVAPWLAANDPRAETAHRVGSLAKGTYRDMLRPHTNRQACDPTALNGLGDRIAGGQAPALSGETGNIAGATHRRLKLVHWRLADELGNEQVSGSGIQDLRWTDLLQLAVIHDRNAIGHRRRLGLVVGDED